MKYYTEKLYPFQNKIIQVIQSCDTQFYLTGGTVLSRKYMEHRYSDDLDFFVNADPKFRDYINKIEAKLSLTGINFNVLIRADDFVRVVTTKDREIELKLDFINDVEYHYDGFEQDEKLGKIDNIQNILSNKIYALPRLEIKDFVDVVFIARVFSFSWKNIIDQAIKKDAWTNPIDISRLFNTIDPNLLKLIKWAHPADENKIERDFQIIAKDVLMGTDNSLVQITR
ncbi:hypothetical protein D4R71_02185 [bacterium]|nr:MAG: hypothetical protein D4R71_02185 [bacterium]